MFQYRAHRIATLGLNPSSGAFGPKILGSMKVSSELSNTSMLSCAHSCMSGHIQVAHFHSLSAHFHPKQKGTQNKKQSQKQEIMKKKLMVESLLKKRRAKEKKEKKRKVRERVQLVKAAGGSNQSMQNLVTPNVPKVKKGPFAHAISGKVYDGKPRTNDEWTKKLSYNRTILPRGQGGFGIQNPRAQELLPHFNDEVGVDFNTISFNDDTPELYPAFHVDAFNGLNGYATEFYSKLPEAIDSLLSEHESFRSSDGDMNQEQARAALQSLDHLVDCVRSFESVLNTANNCAPRNSGQAKKLRRQAVQKIPEVIHQKGEALKQLSDRVSQCSELSALETEALRSINHWLKAYGAEMSASDFQTYLKAYNNMNSHYASLNKKLDSAFFTAIPQAYASQMPKKLQTEITRSKRSSRFMGMETYRLHGGSHPLAAILHIRDPNVRQDVFVQARNAIDFEKSKYVPLLKKPIQLYNTMATTLGFKDPVDMQLSSKYGLKLDQVKNHLKTITSSSMPKKYLVQLIESKKQEASSWKYEDRHPTTVPDHDRLHAEHVLFDEIRGKHILSHLRPFIGIHHALGEVFPQVEKALGVDIVATKAKPGELHRDEHVQKFLVKDKESGSILCKLYFDLFKKRSKKDRSGVDVLRGNSMTVAKTGSVKGSSEDTNSEGPSVPSVIIRTNIRRSAISDLLPPSLSFSELAYVMRLLGEALYEGVIIPRSPYKSIANDISRQAMGAYLTRFAFQKDILKKMSRHIVSNKEMPDEVAQEFLDRNPVVRPNFMSEHALQSLVDLELFSKPSENPADIIREIEGSFGNRKMVPNFSKLARSMERCSSLYVPVYAEMLGAELFDSGLGNVDISQKLVEKVSTNDFNSTTEGILQDFDTVHSSRSGVSQMSESV